MEIINAILSIDVECVELTLDNFERVKKWVESDNSEYTLEHYKPWKYDNEFLIYDATGYFKEIDFEDGPFVIVKFDERTYRALTKKDYLDKLLS